MVVSSLAAEANPAADVEGVDAARKIVILAALAYGALLDPNTIAREGITAITSEHTAMADKLGGSVKLIGHTEMVDGKILAWVSPCFVPIHNPLSQVNDVFNGVLVDGNMLGRALFYGLGAGKLPSARAVVADIIDVVSRRASERRSPTWRAAEAEEIASVEDYVCRRCYFIEGCPRCAEKAKKALGAEVCEFVRDGAFALISAPMSGVQAAEALAATGLQAKFCLPVLD